MSHLNLLPWRETLKREREIRLAVFTGASLAVAGVVVLSAHLFMEGLIDYQESRNGYLGKEIKRVEAQIKEIEDLEKKKQRLIDRMNVIQELESNRPKIVHLFDELVKQLPDGVYFTALEQKNDKLTLEGIAQSDARVSSLMRNIEKSQWLTNPQIQLISAKEEKIPLGVNATSAAKKPRSVSSFKLEVTQTAPKSDELAQ